MLMLGKGEAQICRYAPRPACLGTFLIFRISPREAGVAFWSQDSWPSSFVLKCPFEIEAEFANRGCAEIRDGVKVRKRGHN